MKGYNVVMKIKIDKKKKHEANKLLARMMERARTALHHLNSDCPVEFFIGMGDVHQMCQDVENFKEYLKEVWENQSDVKNIKN